ncbi:Dienelactone hydrolase [Penicillium bovifimosum]|uniref:Dienelactone hydrolase n=1 Tax=Penicillium bovifimosum TaxID=126998 RepID=A0A9W9L6K0_9EURO|nr:Dienelactone hydrolase [Penicillium bovifimosum]KAJ5138942.1 Dienelactone hydrolase [Penicillium bovifimosum]
MVNIFQRFARHRAQSSGNSPPEHGADSNVPNTAESHPHGAQRSLSISSGTRGRRYEVPTPRHLIIVSDTADFDTHVVHRFQAEGFDVSYLPFLGSGDDDKDRKAIEHAVHEKEDELETGERYAIVAYHRPAYLLLAAHHLANTKTNPFPRLCALIAYYPLSSTDQYTYKQNDDCAPPGCSDTSCIFDPMPKSTFLPIQIHLPGPRVQPCAVWPWISLSITEGDVTYKKRHRCHVYAYPGAKAGFGERAVPEEKIGEIDENLNADDELTSQLAWSRALGCLKRAFNIGSHWAVVDIETVWEEYWDRVLGQLEKRKQNHSQDYESVVDTLTGHGHYGELGCPAGEVYINCVPTKAEGTDRIVDEMLFTCRHTAEIPWLLPGVTPTERNIKVVVIVVASFCAGQITRQSLYWDQASVLVQVGLLDPALVPSAQPVT